MSPIHQHHFELRRLEASIQDAIRGIRRSESIAEIARLMDVPIPRGHSHLRRLAPSYNRIEAEAYHRAAGIVRNQMNLLQGAEGTDDFARMHGRFMCEWRLLYGRIPKLAALVQIGSERLILRLAANQASAALHHLPNI